MTELILSLFPGIDLFGRGFEAEGFCVVRGPDPITGGDIRDFHAVPGRFDGVIGGPPCQDFSKLRRSAPTGYGLAMLAEFVRVVGEAAPEWWLMENVPTVPTVTVPGYVTQRLSVRSGELGAAQRRDRHLQWGTRDGLPLVLERVASSRDWAPAAVANDDRPLAELCRLQGLPENFALPFFRAEEAKRAVGNGVPLPVARALARAVRARHDYATARLCLCGCGRLVTGREDAKTATVACRKRLERGRRGEFSLAPAWSLTGQKELFA